MRDNMLSDARFSQCGLRMMCKLGRFLLHPI